MSPADSYRILELSIGASQPEVKAAYHKLVRQWHPDKFHHDPDNQQIAERKIREINGAYSRLTKSDETQRDADKVPEDAVDANGNGSTPPRTRGNNVFYTDLEEAIRAGTSTSEGHPQNRRADDAFTHQQASAQSEVAGSAACAYVGGDPRLEHIESGYLGCSAVVTWNSSGVALSITGAASVAYPPHSIRSIRLTRRSSLAFLSGGTVRIQITNSAGIGDDGFSVKLRFRDRITAELFANQLAKTFAVETRVDNGWFNTATLMILLLIVLAGLGISIVLSVKRDSLAIESANAANRSFVSGNEEGETDQSEASIAVVAQQAVPETDAGAQAESIAEIERSGGSVIQTNGRVVRVKLAGARVDANLLTFISGLEELEELNLNATTISGEEFRHLSGLSKLRVLDLGSTRNASAGVKSLIGLTRLQVLRLSNTDISDPELKLLKQLPDLQEVELISTQVTDIGIDDFNASVPQCIVVK